MDELTELFERLEQERDEWVVGLDLLAPTTETLLTLVAVLDSTGRSLFLGDGFVNTAPPLSSALGREVLAACQPFLRAAYNGARRDQPLEPAYLHVCEAGCWTLIVNKRKKSACPMCGVSREHNRVELRWEGLPKKPRKRKDVIVAETSNAVVGEVLDVEEVGTVERTAVISSCGLYRYRLGRHRVSSSLPDRVVLFVMLNPSIADADQDDRTLKRCMDFAWREGGTSLEIVNLYAYRTPKPAALIAAHAEGVDVVGPENERYVLEALSEVHASGGLIIAGWGGSKTPARTEREAAICAAVGGFDGLSLHALHINDDGTPKHPLYIKADAPLLPYG